MKHLRDLEASMNRIRTLGVLVSAVLLVGGFPGSPATAAPVWLTSDISWVNPDLTSSSPQPRVVDLTFAHHARYDRVVIRLRAGFPGGSAHYQRRFSYDGSGLPVPIGGASGLEVSLTPAVAHDGSGNNVYVGPDLARPKFQTLKALAFTGDFEGHVTFAFALTHRAPYRIFTLVHPRRLVIDFRHQT
jgi:hypothetical protein